MSQSPHGVLHGVVTTAENGVCNNGSFSTEQEPIRIPSTT